MFLYQKYGEERAFVIIVFTLFSIFFKKWKFERKLKKGKEGSKIIGMKEKRTEVKFQPIFNLLGEIKEIWNLKFFFYEFLNLKDKRYEGIENSR
jgi:hypothetical protein